LFSFFSDLPAFDPLHQLEKSLDPPSTMDYSVYLVVLLTLLPFAAAQCPVTDQENCRCQRKFMYYNYIYCERMGNVTQVPPFTASATEYNELHIKLETTLQTIQADAFSGLTVYKMRLQGIGLQSMNERAFAGAQINYTQSRLHNYTLL
jgi:hypothetical protein